ncbi:uncharacterized protein TRIADDRAFT_23130 [Trichoplax adhaerens]|uniref:Polypeptide N-acetylgalactosaminyltransferase n=1 Tax=Trichoplax adhaerens TaxID=10228 RepID=B3RR10_TRIAD|nr:hypothetical protein TRIADDRAFT_23130 [Trichoplax adhaerens]EDV26798.1 hypothetical protein TRIADDRAFT_23130 [Trichoplax adhaerens]|eukprot:XP_002110794.1 hypothetical protein TRIADDRAFT_23130 [Trichoplax adhaerens]
MADSNNTLLQSINPNKRLIFQPTLPHNFNPNAIGENGESVIVPDKAKAESDKLFKNHGFNQWASDHMSLHRTLPDLRPSLCKSQVFPKDLPQTSVVIVFHNEALSTLLRTVHSVLDRSAPDLIHQIILVDDFSSIKGHDPLKKYIADLKKVILVRNPKREGLIRSRIIGYSRATAPIVTFLDAHCEVTIGWLEPLLDRVHQNRSVVVCPEIDVIDDKTFQYRAGSSGDIRGVFNWDMKFRWRLTPSQEQKRRNNYNVLFARSPTMAGGLFAIDRQYFQEIGLYDSQMDIWGGENLELSFRIWQCGGQLEIMPCSHVGHVFRNVIPYKFPKDAGLTINKNSVRTAEVWMDGYKEFVYQRQPYMRNIHFGNITERLELRKKLQCKSFKWYLDHVFTDVILPNESAIAKGKVRNPESEMCLNTLGRPKHAFLGLSPCAHEGKTMIISLTVLNELAMDEVCFDVSDHQSGGKITLLDCHSMGGNQFWSHKKNGKLQHRDSGLCLDRGTGINPVMQPCKDVPSQIWTFDNYYPNVKPRKLN